MFGFFGSDKKQDSPAPQPQNTPQQPQRIIEKKVLTRGLKAVEPVSLLLSEPLVPMTWTWCLNGMHRNIRI